MISRNGKKKFTDHIRSIIFSSGEMAFEVETDDGRYIDIKRILLDVEGLAVLKHAMTTSENYDVKDQVFELGEVGQ